MPSMVRKNVFNKDLQACFADNNGTCPQVFCESLRLLQEGLHTPGLFSGTSDQRKVQLLQRAWDQGRNPLKLAKIHDFVAVSDCLLNWLNSLPSPLIPCRLFQAFLHTQHTCVHTEWLAQIHLLFDKLSSQESEIALPLLSFLHDYEKQHRGKDLRKNSLGRVFGPALLKAHANALPLPFPEDVRATAQLVDCIITDYDVIFRPPQSPCSSPVKKPQSGGKISSPPRKSFSQLTKQEDDKRQAFAAKMIRLETAKLKPLRVALPSLCQADTGSLRDENLPPLNQSHSKDGAVFPAPCSGSEPNSSFALEGRDSDLDTVVGDLLCGSLTGVLFEPDDEKFAVRTSTILSGYSSLSISPVHSDGSGEMSVDGDCLQYIA